MATTGSESVRNALQAMQSALKATFPDGLPASLRDADILATEAISQFDGAAGVYVAQTLNGVHHLMYRTELQPRPSDSVGSLIDEHMASRAAAALNACKNVPSDHLATLIIWCDAVGGYHGLRYR